MTNFKVYINIPHKYDSDGLCKICGTHNSNDKINVHCRGVKSSLMPTLSKVDKQTITLLAQSHYAPVDCIDFDTQKKEYVRRVLWTLIEILDFKKPVKCENCKGLNLPNTPSCIWCNSHINNIVESSHWICNLVSKVQKMVFENEKSGNWYFQIKVEQRKYNSFPNILIETSIKPDLDLVMSLVNNCLVNPIVDMNTKVRTKKKGYRLRFVGSAWRRFNPLAKIVDSNLVKNSSVFHAVPTFFTEDAGFVNLENTLIDKDEQHESPLIGKYQDGLFEFNSAKYHFGNWCHKIIAKWRRTSRPKL